MTVGRLAGAVAFGRGQPCRPNKEETRGIDTQTHSPSSLLPITSASHWLNPTRNQRIRKPIEAEGQPSGTQNRRRVDLERQMENIQQYLFPVMYTNVDRCIQEMTSMDK